MPVVLYLGLFGVIGLVTGAGIVPDTLTVILPYWMVLVWTVCIAVGGIAGTFGAFGWRTRVESCGLLFLIWGATMYGAVVSVAGYPYGFAAAAIAIAVDAMCILRIHDLSKIRHEEHSHDLAKRVTDHRGL